MMMRCVYTCAVYRAARRFTAGTRLAYHMQLTAEAAVALYCQMTPFAARQTRGVGNNWLPSAGQLPDSFNLHLWQRNR